MTTLATLQSDIAVWVSENVDALTESFIRMAEADLRRDVRVRAQEKTTTLTASNQITPLPADFLKLRALTKPGTDTQLEFMTPEKIRESAEWIDSDQSTAFSIEGTNLILAPAPSEAIDLNIVYVCALPSILEEGVTNWVLTTAYDVYLYACLRHAAVYLEDDAMALKYNAVYERAVEKLNREQKLSRFGGSSPVRRGVPTP